MLEATRHPARRIGYGEGNVLTEEELNRFNTDGYLVFPGFFDETWSTRLTQALDGLRVTRRDSKAVVPNEVFNSLIWQPALVAIVRSILGATFLFHHANGRALASDAPGKPWHHDFDGPVPWSLGLPKMVHVMGYPQGIDEECGPLVVLPGSHTRTVERGYPNAFGFDTLEGEKQITGDTGLLVVLNSALWHVRRENRSNRTRYYFNLSYCQFGTERPEREKYREILERLRTDLAKMPDPVIPMLLQPDTVNLPARQ